MMFKSQMDITPLRDFHKELRETIPEGHIAIFNNHFDKSQRPYRCMNIAEVRGRMQYDMRRGILSRRSGRWFIERSYRPTPGTTQEYEIHTSNRELLNYLGVY
jgi:hypothetical protein